LKPNFSIRTVPFLWNPWYFRVKIFFWTSDSPLCEAKIFPLATVSDWNR
jgi:hypothetical protein